MRTKLRFIGPVAAALLVVGVGASLVSASSGLSGSKTLTFEAKQVQFNFVDNKPAGPGVGDEIAVSENLLGNGKQIGHSGVHCTAAHVNPLELECEATYAFSGGGALTAQTLFHHVNGPQTFPIAITGGFGIYQNAGGAGTIKDITSTLSKVTLHVIVP